MKDKWAKKWDEVSSQQRREQEVLEEMEETYRTKHQTFEERYNRLEEYRQRLQHGIDAHYEETVAMLQQNSSNPNFEEAYQNLVRLTEEATQISQNEFLTHHQRLVDEEEKFEQSYSKKHSAQEDKIDALYWELVKIDLAEKEEKGIK